MIFEFIGDICAIGNKCLICNQPIKETSESILVANLEQSIETNERADKSTVIAEDYRTIQLINAYDIDVICNANNHAHDSNEKGFFKLQEICQNLGIDLIGIGQTQEAALKALPLNKNVYVITACQNNFPTLRNIKIADGKFGVAHLNLKKIKTIVEELPDTAHVVIFVHWGIEHVPIPHPTVRELASELSKNNKVKLIIGTHPHLVQPMEVLNGCQIFYSIGNFMFPNFVISPPTQIDNKAHFEDCDFSTYSYHKVIKPTYKRWPLLNRLSQKIVYNSVNGNVDYVFYKQDPNENKVVKLGRLSAILFKVYLSLWGFILKLPMQIYVPSFEIIRQYIRLRRNSYIAFQYLKQGGVSWFIAKLKQSLS